VRQPYKRDNWKGRLKIGTAEDDLPDVKQKREAVGDMLGGFCSYLNKVGHHLAPASDHDGPLVAVFLDH
jgi:hypothetical protein